MDRIREALEGATAYLREHPAEARSTDSWATAALEDGLVVRTRGADGASVTTDMVASVGGTGSAPSPGWLLRAALASCVATLVAMRAAQTGVRVDGLEVTVDSESDDRGILGIDDGTPAGPLSVRVRTRIRTSDSSPGDVEDLVRWGIAHCPVVDAIRRAVPVDSAVEIG